MEKTDYIRFIDGLRALGKQDRVYNLDITPWLYDLLEPTLDDKVDLRLSCEVLAGALWFFQPRLDVNSEDYPLEVRSWRTFMHQLTVRHNNSIGMYAVSSPAMRCMNNTYKAVFTELSDQLQRHELDTPERVATFTTVVATIITLAYSEENALPIPRLPSIQYWRPVNYLDMVYDITHKMSGARHILKLEGTDYTLYQNVKTNQCLRLPSDEAFKDVHYVALAVRDIDKRKLDLSYYGLDLESVERISDLVKPEEI